MKLTHKICFIALFCCVYSSLIQAQRPELLYLRFNAGSGFTVVDQSIPGLPGTNMVLQNGITWNSNDPAVGSSCLRTSTGAPNGLALCLSGAPVNYSGDWTIEFWAKLQANPSLTPGATIFGSPSTSFVIESAIADSGFDYMTLSGPGLNSARIRNAPLQNTWHHYAFIHDSTALTLTPVLDGVLLPSVRQESAIDIIGHGASGLLIGGGVMTSLWPGLIDEFRIWSRPLSVAEIGANLSLQLNSEILDIGVAAITSPVQSSSQYVGFSINEPVTIRVANFGSSPLPSGSSIPLEFQLNNDPPVIENLVLTSSLPTGESVTHTFSSTVDLSNPGPWSISATTNLVGDLNPINDLRLQAAGGNSGFFINTFPFVDDFDSPFEAGPIPPRLWKQLGGNGSEDWEFLNDIHSFTGGVGPIADHTTGIVGQGFAAMVPAANGSTDVSLEGPIIDLGGNLSPRLDFWLHSWNTNVFATDNEFSLDLVLEPSGSVVLDVLGPIGEVADDWVIQRFDLAPFAGQVLRPRLRVDASLNTSLHNIFVDDFRIKDHPTGMGQPPQPGLAVMDLNSAMSVGELDVSFLENGPYSAVATIGGDLDFRFEGVPDQPILLLFGGLNLASATFPAIGQMDIGGPLDPLTGIPTSIGLLFDGTSPTGLNPLFRTNIHGESDLHFSMPILPIGILTTFQAAISDGASGIYLSNAVELEVN